MFDILKPTGLYDRNDTQINISHIKTQYNMNKKGEGNDKDI